MMERGKLPEMGARGLIVAMLLGGMGLVNAGCESRECAQMRRCCTEVRGRPGVGKACGTLLEQVDDPGSCVGVTQSVVAMLEEKGESIPEACRVAKAAEKGKTNSGSVPQ